MLKIGDTFLLPKNEDWTEHLWIIITKPDENGKAVCVNISSLRDSCCDKTVVLQPREHPFIKKASVVMYADARDIPLRDVQRVLEGNYNITCAKKQPCSSQLLKEIQEGLLTSKTAGREILDKCRRSWGR